MKLYALIPALTALLLTAAPLGASAKGWEVSKGEKTETRHIIKDSDIEIRATRGLIQVNVSHPVQIKIFTILGQLISSETLQPGSHQFTVSAHGVYIVKAGDLTCKVAL
ncbi:MAG: DUF6383 domain-containing protein [Muribaculum sp.]|nr:DUF6383 domain-containing protein [Muribaculum sp.]